MLSVVIFVPPQALRNSTSRLLFAPPGDTLAIPGVRACSRQRLEPLEIIIQRLESTIFLGVLCGCARGRWAQLRPSTCVAGAFRGTKPHQDYRRRTAASTSAALALIWRAPWRTKSAAKVGLNHVLFTDLSDRASGALRAIFAHPKAHLTRISSPSGAQEMAPAAILDTIFPPAAGVKPTKVTQELCLTCRGAAHLAPPRFQAFFGKASSHFLSLKRRRSRLHGKRTKNTCRDPFSRQRGVPVLGEKWSNACKFWEIF